MDHGDQEVAALARERGRALVGYAYLLALGVSVGAVKRYLSTGTHRLEALLGPVRGRPVPDTERTSP